MDISYLIIPACFFYFVLGLFVYRQNRKSIVNRSFCVFILIVAIWSIGLFIYGHPVLFSRLFWIKFVYSIGFIMPLSIFHFATVFPPDSERPSRLSLIIYTLISLLNFYLLLFTNLFVKGIVSENGEYYTILGPAYLFVGALASSYAFWGIFILAKKYRASGGLIKLQLRYILLGFFLFVLTALFIDAALPVITGKTEYFAISPLSFLFFIIFTTLAITRYHLFESRVILTELLVGIMGLILLILPFMMPTAFLKALTAVIFLLFCLFSYLLIKTTYQEIKRRERTERISKELEEAKNRSEALLTSISDGVVGIDENQKIIYFNLAAEKLTGFKTSDVLGKPYYNFLHLIRERERTEITPFVSRALKGEMVIIDSDNTLLVRKDRRQLPVEASVAPIQRKRGKVAGVIVVFRDVSKERKIQQIQAEFSSLVSHEIMSPITVIKGYLEVLAEEAGKLTKEQREAVNNAREASKSLLSLIEELIGISRLEREDKEIKSVLINPVELANKAITKEILRLFENKKQKFTLKKPKTLPKIKVDPALIITPIHNLLSNASKYTPKGGKIELKIYSNPHDIIFQDEVVFQVTDTGMGIPKGEQNKVFQRFFRASNTTQLARGTGLGLYLTKLMIELSGGRVWFKSIQNKGTTFFVMLPIHKK